MLAECFFQISSNPSQKMNMPQRTLMVLALTAATPALAQLEALQRCAQEPVSVARLACYDKLLPPPVRSGAAGSVSPAAPALAQPAKADTFGLPQTLKGPSPTVESSVGADFDGWSPNDKIRLANGQVWQVVDGSSAAVAPRVRRVTVRGGALGGFLLDLEGLNTTPRVRRIE
jgi:lipoprotein-anchoring transpeptidase ErfK/SrfK